MLMEHSKLEFYNFMAHAYYLNLGALNFKHTKWTFKLIHSKKVIRKINNFTRDKCFLFSLSIESNLEGREY